MIEGDPPLHWDVVTCDRCCKMSYISIVDEWDSDDRFCPNCGISFDVTESENNDYEDDIN